MAQRYYQDGQEEIYDAAVAYRGHLDTPPPALNLRSAPPHPTNQHPLTDSVQPFAPGRPPLSDSNDEEAPETLGSVTHPEQSVPEDHGASKTSVGPGSRQRTDESRGVIRKTTVASRETRTTAITSRSATRLSHSSWLPSRWAGALLLTVVLEAVVVISMVGTVFGMIQHHTRSDLRVQDLKTVSVFFSLTIFGMVFIVLIALDATRLKNTIQVIGVTVFNIALLVTAALEISQVRKALRLQDESGAGIECPSDPMARCSGLDDLFPSVERFLIVVPIIVGLAQVPLTALALKLWTEWGWRIYKIIGADIKIRRYYLCYQVLVVLLKFDFFFGIGFTMSYLILVVNQNDWEYGVTIAAVPLAVLLLFLCAFSARRENVPLMVLSVICFLAGGVYFIYKITRIYEPSTADQYRTVRLTLTFFSIFATLSLLLTLANALLCLSNFGKGLRQAHDAIGHVGGHGRRRTNDRKSVEGFSVKDPTPVTVDDARPHTSIHFDHHNPSRLSLD